MEVKQVLSVATDISGLMLKYGGEVYRAEDSARYICKAYGYEEADVFAISTNIMVTVSRGDDCITKTRRILDNQVDLTKVDRLNNLSRWICEQQPSYEEIQEQMTEILSIAPYNLASRMLAVGLISFSFALIFGGTLWDGVTSCAIGMVAALVQAWLGKRKTNYFLCIALCSFLMSTLSFFAMDVSQGQLQAEPILAGTLMILVPGLALTNCMRDLMAKDYVAGVTKFTEASMTALATALGVAAVILGVYPL